MEDAATKRNRQWARRSRRCASLSSSRSLDRQVPRTREMPRTRRSNRFASKTVQRDSPAPCVSRTSRTISSSNSGVRPGSDRGRTQIIRCDGAQRFEAFHYAVLRAGPRFLRGTRAKLGERSIAVNVPFRVRFRQKAGAQSVAVFPNHGESAETHGEGYVGPSRSMPSGVLVGSWTATGGSIWDSRFTRRSKLAHLSKWSRLRGNRARYAPGRSKAVPAGTDRSAACGDTSGQALTEAAHPRVDFARVEGSGSDPPGTQRSASTSPIPCHSLQ